MRSPVLLSFLLCLLFLALTQAGRDFYGILGLQKNCDEKALKKAYRKLSMKWHPDTNGGSKEAEEKFQEVALAYEVLSNPDKRRIYDQHGEAGLDKHLQQQNHDTGGDPFDIFSQFFGGGARRPQHREAQRGPDVVIPVPTTLEDLYIGTNFEMSILQQVLCSHCRGTGADSDDHFHTCSTCKGQGVVMHVQQIGPGFVQQMQRECSACGGKGKVITKQCHVCSGKKREQGHRTLDVYIDSGMKDGARIEFPHASDEEPEMNAGNVIFIIQQLPHPFYTRDGDDLKCEIVISLKESLTGFERHLTHLDGRKITIRRTSITKPNSVIKLKDEGMPTEGTGKGMLHVKVIVKFPQSLTAEQKQVVQTIF